MITYNSKFIPALSHTLHPLHQLLHKNSPWVWKAKHQKVFVTAKHLLCEGSMLVHYDVKKPIKLFCDASAYGLGACLTLLMPNGDVRPIAYASQRLTGPEQNYMHRLNVKHWLSFWGSASSINICMGEILR